MVDFPRLLFVTPVAFNPYSGGGATFASLFQSWPKDKLATIHNDRAPTSDNICNNYFYLGSDELDFVLPFNLMRRAAAPEDRTADVAAAPSSALPSCVNAAREFILGDSIPERARLTVRLQRWISDFRPDLIYTILGSNGMMALIEQIRGTFDLPLVVHIMDDWASTAHRRGLFAPLERPRMQRQLTHFFAVAAGCLGISPAMCEAYAQRYGRPFIPFQYALDRERWGAIAKRDLHVAETPELLYVGSIFRNAQLESLIDCARAVTQLNTEGFSLRLRIITSATNRSRFGSLLKLHSNIALDVSEGDDTTFFRTLANADALLLPVNFDEESIEFIQYSMPTKVPAYLNSGTPVLAYGSPETAQVRYAADGGWALIVARRSPAELKISLKRIVTDMALRQTLSTAAREAAAKHDSRTVRTGFQDFLSRSAKRQN